MELYEKYISKKAELDRVKAELESLQGQVYMAHKDAIDAKGIGSVTATVGDFKINITTKENTRFNMEALKNLDIMIPTKLDVSKKFLKELKEKDEKAYSDVMACAEISPAKPSFKVATDRDWET